MTASTERCSPLGGWTERFAAASAQPRRFALGETPFLTQLNLRGNAADPGFASAVRSATGLELAVTANTWNGTPVRSMIWLGPDEWLIVTPDAERNPLLGSLGESLRGRHHSLADVSANRTALELSGADARSVLAKGCPLDLHARAFAPPQSAQSVLAKAQVLLQCVSAEPAVRIFVRNSFAAYLAEWLLDAAAESAASRTLDAGRIAARLA